MCDEDFSSIISVAIKASPDDLNGQIIEAKLQIKHYYDVSDLCATGFNQELIKFKEYAKKSYPGRYDKQLASLRNIVKKITSYRQSTSLNSLSNNNTNELENSLIDEESSSTTITRKIPKKKIRQNLAISLIAKKSLKSNEIANTTQSNSTNDSSEKENYTASEQYSRTPSHTKNEFKVTINSKALIKYPIAKNCNFTDFIKKIQVSIKVQPLQSFDAFDFESVNNHIIVIINSTHPFYLRLYCDSSPESKNIIDMMISSLCHLSHLSISEKIRNQDKKLFSRWSEYLEEYLLEERQ